MAVMLAAPLQHVYSAWLQTFAPPCHGAGMTILIPRGGNLSGAWNGLGSAYLE
jgi:hypothetical protein